MPSSLLCTCTLICRTNRTTLGPPELRRCIPDAHRLPLRLYSGLRQSRRPPPALGLLLGLLAAVLALSGCYVEVPQPTPLSAATPPAAVSSAPPGALVFTPLCDTGQRTVWTGKEWSCEPSVDLQATTGRSASVVVAASDADPRQIRQADFRCDGRDDHVEIAAALASLPAAGGKVLLSEGVFRLGATLVIAQNNRGIEGMGPSATTVKATGDYPVFWFAGSSDNVINRGGLSNLTVRGGGKSLASAHGVVLEYVNRTVVENIVLHSTRHALHVKDAWQLAILNVSAHGRGSDQNYIGLYGAESLGDNAVVAHNFQTQSTESHGIRLKSFSGSKFTSCEVGTAGGKGWYIGAPDHTVRNEFLHVANSLSDTIAEEAWYIDGRGARGGYATDMQFANIWAGTAAKGLHVVNGANITFSNVLFKAFAQDAVFIEKSFRVDLHGGYVGAWGNAEDDTYSGVVLKDSYKSSVEGIQLVASHPFASVEEWGDAYLNRIVDNDVGDGGTIVVTASDTIVGRNSGFRTQNSGTAVIASATFVRVEHGLSYEPAISDISVTPTNDLGDATKFWISDAGPHSFDIRVDRFTTHPASFAWNVRRD